MSDEKPNEATYEEVVDGTIGKTRTGKRLLDPDTVKRMKEAGLPKPDDVSQGSWDQLQEVKVGAHTAVAHMAASGVRPKHIAEALGLSPATVTTWLKSEKMKFEVKRLQHRMFGKDPASRFRTLVNDATSTLVEAMQADDAKHSVKIMAANSILDRALGKPKQHLLVEGSIIRKIYENLDTGKDTVIEVESQESREVEEIGPGENPNTVEKIDHSANPNLNSRWSDWAKENL